MTLRPTRPRVYVSSKSEVAQKREQALRHDQSQQSASEAVRIADKSLRVSEKSLAWTKLSAAVAVVGLAYPLVIGMDRPDQRFASVDPAGTLSGNEEGRRIDMAGGNNFDEIVNNTEGTISNLPGFLSGVSYTYGISLGTAGILKINDHVENAGQMRLQYGSIRLASEGGLFDLTLPYDKMERVILVPDLPKTVDI